MKREQPFSGLAQFLPAGTFEQVLPYFKEHTIHLTLARERKSILGDYRRPTVEQPVHRISINATLNQYSFLITLLHELAHMFVFIQYKDKVSPHGSEWKVEFRKMLIPYLGKHFFPPDIESALINYLNNPKASTCTDTNLYKALYRYSHSKEGVSLLEDMQINQRFSIANGNEYIVLEKRRTRFRCKEIKTGKMYLFPSIYEVRLISEN
jgi:SprT protein